MKKSLLLFSSIISIALFAQPTSWNITGIGGGGGLWRPSINPANDNEYYLHTEMGSIFHTTDFGQTYSEIGFRQLNAAQTTTVQFTNNPNILYAIGHKYPDRGGLAAPSFYKSIDAGVTWTMLKCVSDFNAVFGNWQLKDASLIGQKMYVDYNNPNRIVFATAGNIYISIDGGNTMTDISQQGQCGACWDQSLNGCYFDGNNIYIGWREGVLVSTNGGVTFSKAALTGVPANEFFVSFAVAKQNGITRFFCITYSDMYDNLHYIDNASSYINKGIIFKSFYTLDYNSSTVWQAKNTGIAVPTSNSCASCDFIIRMAIAENDINTVYLEGTNNTGEPVILKTTNAGNNWSDILHITNNQNVATGYFGYQGDSYLWWVGAAGIAVAPNNSNKVVLTNLGTVLKTSNGGTDWQQAYVNPADQNPAGAPTPKHKLYRGAGFLHNTANWHVLWNDANNVVGGITDIGANISPDNGIHWKYPNFNYNTLYCTVKGTGGTIYGAASGVHDLYRSYYYTGDANIDNSTHSNGEIMFSNDNGNNWATLKNFGRPVYWLAIDPNNQNKMYASVVNYTQGLGGIYVTNNLSAGASATWTKLPDPPRTERHPATIVVLNDGKVVCSYSARTNANQKFTKSSGIFLYDPNTNTWSDRTDLNKMAWYCNDVVVDPHDLMQNTWYACVSSGYGGQDATNTGSPNDQGGLFKTTDRGLTWTKLMSTNADLSGGGGIFSCSFNPNNPDQLFIASGVDGLFVSNNISSATPTIQPVNNFLFAAAGRIFFNPYKQTEMWVTTFGNGIHVGNLSTTGIFESTERNASLRLYPNPATNSFTVELNEINGFDNLRMIDVTGRVIQNHQITKSSNNQINISTIGIPNGVYFVEYGNYKSKIVINH